jgi:hypothetical protein
MGCPSTSWRWYCHLHIDFAHDAETRLSDYEPSSLPVSSLSYQLVMLTKHVVGDMQVKFYFEDHHRIFSACAPTVKPLA